MDRNKETCATETQLILAETIRRLLSDFRQQLHADIRQILSDKKPMQEKPWLKSSEVRKLLGVSHGTLQNLRNNGTIPFTKIGGVVYYPRDGIEKMLSGKTSFFT